MSQPSEDNQDSDSGVDWPSGSVEFETNSIDADETSLGQGEDNARGKGKRLLGDQEFNDETQSTKRVMTDDRDPFVGLPSQERIDKYGHPNSITLSRKEYPAIHEVGSGPCTDSALLSRHKAEIQKLDKELGPGSWRFRHALPPETAALKSAQSYEKLDSRPGTSRNELSEFIDASELIFSQGYTIVDLETVQGDSAAQGSAGAS